VAARLSEQAEDYLAADNAAWTVAQAAQHGRVLLVSAGNRFLETAFGLLPEVELVRVAPAEAGPVIAAGGFNLIVFDSQPVPDLPAGPALLLINPQPPAAAEEEPPLDLSVAATFTQTAVTRIGESPLLQFVEWGNVHVRQAVSVAAPWAEPLVAAEGGPLLLAGESGGRRVAVLAFRLQDSDLPLQIAFPLLMANLTAWLTPGRAFEAADALLPGDAVALKLPPAAADLLITRPDGTEWSAAAAGRPAAFDQTSQPGLYQVALVAEDGSARPLGAFAVNLFAPAESAIAPAASIRLGTSEVQSAAQERAGQLELWPWLALAAGLFLVVEWWVYHRGPALPGRLALPPFAGRRRGA
ncbi:MAG: hypothetical protein ACRDHL_02680, partial [Candidatus Promineifilaceae bacterium]